MMDKKQNLNQTNVTVGSLNLLSRLKNNAN